MSNDPYAGIAAPPQDPYTGIAAPPAAARPPVSAGPTPPPVNQGGTIQFWNPAQLWNPAARNFDTGIQVGPNVQNFLAGAGETFAGIPTQLQRYYANATGDTQKQQALDKVVKEQRQQDAPLNATWAGTLGRAAPAVVASFVPGAQTVAGGATIGALSGALTPTTSDESSVANTALGASGGAAGSYIGGKVASWAAQRAAQPFMGWTRATANKAAAESVGSDAPALTQDAIAGAKQRFTQIFGQAHSPTVTVQVGQGTQAAVNRVAGGLNRSTADALRNSDGVQDLLAYVQSGNANAQQLGKISSDLGRDAAAQMGSKTGDKALGRALYQVQDHVDALVGNSIQNPTLRQAYNAAVPQYRNYMTLTRRPTLLNSVTGDVNPPALGKYLQRYDDAYRTGQGGNPLYSLARWGQRTGQVPAPPPANLSNLGLPRLGYYATTNPASRFAGGVVSNTIAGVPGASAVTSRVTQGLLAGDTVPTVRGMFGSGQ
jgi:hypothetical protein